MERHDFVVPFFNGQYRFDKPPLTYWAIASSLSVFGHTEFAARLPNALCFVGAIFLLLRFGRRLTPVQPWRAALIYATFVFPFSVSNIVTTAR